MIEWAISSSSLSVTPTAACSRAAVSARATNRPAPRIASISPRVFNSTMALPCLSLFTVAQFRDN